MKKSKQVCRVCDKEVDHPIILCGECYTRHQGFVRAEEEAYRRVWDLVKELNSILERPRT